MAASGDNQRNRECSDSSLKTTEINDVKDVIGEWGKLQLWLMVALIFINLPAAWNNLGMPFMAPNIDHWCSRPLQFSNISTEQWKNFTIPYIIQDSKIIYSKCEMYDTSLSPSTIRTNRTKIPCDSWEYDHSFYKRTIIDQWDLVCNRSWMPSFAGSMYFSGFLITVSVSGQLSDSYGRRLMMLVTIGWSFVFGLICSFAANFWMFAVFRFIFALGRAASFLCLYLLLMEMIGNKERVTVGLVDKLGWAFSQMLLPAFSWGTRDWFYLHLGAILPFGILFLCLWFSIESPRWLLSQGKISEAEKAIKKICEINGRDISNLSETVNVLAKKVTEEDEKQGGKKTFLDIMRSPVLRKSSLILYVIWIIKIFAYYAMSFTAEDVGGNVHVFFALSALVEIPAGFLYYYLQSRVGRKRPLMISMFITGTTCLIAIAVPKDKSSWIIALTVISKFFMSISFSSIYLLATEIYPTVVRAVGLGSCSMMGRVGAIIAPFMKEAAVNVHWSFPLVIIGSFSIFGSLLVILLPETKDIDLADTVGQGENIGIRAPSIKKIFRRSREESRL